MRIAQLGTFDVENYGDLLFPLILKRRLPPPEFEVVGVSPVGGPPVYEDCLPVISFDEFAATGDAFQGMVVGGGNIIHASPTGLRAYDRGGFFPLLAYANLWIGAAAIAGQRNIPLCWNAPGVPAPLGGDIARAVRWSLSRVAYASVRDAASREFLAGCSGPAEIRVVPDTAVEVSRLWSRADLVEAYRTAFLSRGMSPHPATIAFHLNERYIDEAPEAVAGRIDRICARTGTRAIILALGPCHGDDDLGRRVARAMRTQPLLVDRPLSLRESTACIMGSRAYIGSSLHGMITACSFGLPGILVGSRQVTKFSGFLDQFGIASWHAETWKAAEERCGDLFAAPAEGWRAVLPAASPLLDEHWGRIADCLRSGRVAGDRSGFPERAGEPPSILGDGLLRDVLAHGAMESFRKQEKLRLTALSLRRDLRGKRWERSSGAEGESPAKEAAGAAREGAALQEAAVEKEKTEPTFPQLLRFWQEQMAEVRQLRMIIENLRSLITALLRSRQMKLAAALAKAYQTLARKPREPTFRKRFSTIFDSFAAWEKRRRQAPAIPMVGGAALGDAVPERRRRSADIVIAVHNAPDDFRRCIESVRLHTNLSSNRLILVDDGSDAETARAVLQAACELGGLCIRNERRQGYTRAANQGLRAATGDCIVLLNSDTVVVPGWLEKLIVCVASNSRTAAAGPLSNAASWQSIPDQTDQEGRWRVNALPEGMDLVSYADAISRSSPRLYPRVTLLNGFCYLVSRQALEAVGLLDEETFPQGYGEEDDLSFRLADAGFDLRVADDCYVFHAKSRSFTPELRNAIVETSKGSLARKHGTERFNAADRSMRENEDLLRARVAADIAGRAAAEGAVRRNCASWGLSLGWLMPHLECVGGVRRAIEMSNRLAAWGIDAVLLTPDGKRTDWLPIASGVDSFEAMGRRRFDVLVATDPDVIEPFMKGAARLKVLYHLAAYRFYREPTKRLRAYCSVRGAAVHIANSRWTAEQIRDLCEVERVLPGGINRNLFHPVAAEVTHDLVCFGSHREIKGTKVIQAAAEGLKLLMLEELHAPQKDLARHISSARIFVSACAAEGFNFCTLEAMACGVPVAMTDDGGSREYARDGENALVVKDRDPRALRAAIDRLLEDTALRARLIESGMRTAYGYTWERATVGLVDLLAAKLGLPCPAVEGARC